MKHPLKTKVGMIIQFLSDEELKTSTEALDFQLAANSEFMRGRAYEAKRTRKEIHGILGDPQSLKPTKGVRADG